MAKLIFSPEKLLQSFDKATEGAFCYPQTLPITMDHPTNIGNYSLEDFLNKPK